MPDHAVPGAPAAGTTCLIPPLLTDLSRALIAESNVSGEASKLTGEATVESALSCAVLVSGMIAFEQTLGNELRDCYEDLRGLERVVNGGLSTISTKEGENASSICRMNDK